MRKNGDRPVLPEEKALWDSAMQGVEKQLRRKKITRNAPNPVFAPKHGFDLLAPLPTPKTDIDAKLDLHGFTEAEAYAALLRGVESAFQRGKRCLLVITGKGKEGQGVLRQRVPLWLEDRAICGHIASYQEAGLKHGGKGALYVFLKKKGKPAAH